MRRADFPLRVHLLLLFLAIPLWSFSQQHSIATGIGIGGGSFYAGEGTIPGFFLRSFIGVAAPFLADEDNRQFSGGFLYRYREGPVRLGTGVRYHFRKGREITIGSLRMPFFTMDYPIGEGIRFVPGLGFYLDLPLNYSIKSSDVRSVESLSGGVQMKLGVDHRFSERYTIELSYIFSQDLSPVYKSTWYLASGREGGGEPKKGWSGSLRVSLSYTLGSNSSSEKKE